MLNLMVDIETAATGPNATILSIGVVTFDEDTIYDAKCYYPRLDEQKDRDVDLGTMRWWMDQETTARCATFSPHTTKTETRTRDYIRQDFDQYFTNCARLWACGTDFDYVILNGYLKTKFPYWKQYDYRTIRNLFGGGAPVANPAKHSALDDALAQTKELQRIAKALNKRAPKGKRLLAL